jgi:predicted HTH domain antitoxin
VGSGFTFRRVDSLTIQIPESVLLQSGASREALQREGQFWLALRFFQSGRLTSGQAATMCGMNRVDFLLAAGREGVPVEDLDGAELDREIGATLGE